VAPVFLRLLEYFEGIMFLTTNRIMNFDTAFKSRIHLAIKYPGLSETSQRQLWTTFITNDFQRDAPYWLTEDLLDDLGANRELNGRQIKNVVRTAMALAVAANRELQAQDIYTSLNAMAAFDKDFEEAMQESLATDRGHIAEDAHSHKSDRTLATGYAQKRIRLD
jgi:transcriptional regulator of acetoin/glycerol metabolism